jgi:hypothetical protein
VTVRTSTSVYTGGSSFEIVAVGIAIAIAKAEVSSCSGGVLSYKVY